MKKLRIAIIVFISILFSINAHSQQLKNYIEGYWYGVLQFQGSELIITFDIKRDANDSLTGIMYSPLQSSEEIPITKFVIQGDSVHISIKSLGVKYSGKIYENDSVIKGVFNQAIFKIPLDMQKTAELFALKRPQEPKPPFDYIIEDVRFENKKEGITLAGTITYPDTLAQYPAVILISGSGPQDRNEEIFGHKPFWVIADYLTKNGISVLRFDDRGIGKSGGDFSKATSMDFANDVEAAVAFLKLHPHIQSQHIGLIGHSEGGMIAPIVATKDKDIAFIVLMAGPGISGEGILLTQIQKMLEIDNNEKSFIDQVLTDSKKTYSILKKNPNPQKAATALRKYYAKRMKKTPEEKHFDFGYSKQAVEMKIQALNGAWFRFFLTFEPEDYLKRVDCPVLALFGEKDVQVLALVNSKALEKIINKHNRKDWHIKVYPDKNHLFQNATKGTIMEYAIIEETIGEDVLGDIVGWIKKRIK